MAQKTTLLDGLNYSSYIEKCEVTFTKFVEAVAKVGECQQEKIKRLKKHSTWVGRIVNKILSCSGTLQNIAAEGLLKMSLSAVTVTPLPTRSLQYFRCLDVVHVQQKCDAAVDRSDRSYRCGKVRHRAKDCKAVVPQCPLYLALGKPAAHRR